MSLKQSRKIRVLIIEDEDDMGEMYKLAFKIKNCEVAVSFNGLDGIVKAAKWKPDLILLDIMMPQMDGYEALKRLKKQNPKVVIVMNSNLEQDKDVRYAMKLGADYFLRKSLYTPFKIVEKVKEILKKKSRILTK